MHYQHIPYAQAEESTSHFFSGQFTASIRVEQQEHVCRRVGDREHFGLDTAHARLHQPGITRWLWHPVLSELLHALISSVPIRIRHAISRVDAWVAYR
jgi:hypothetical protein